MSQHTNTPKNNDGTSDFVYYRAKGAGLEAIQKIWHVNPEQKAATTATEIVENLKTLNIVDSKAVQIHKTDKTYPRAYIVPTEVYDIRKQDGTEFIFRVPVDYKGNHTAPKDSERLTADETTEIEKYLGQGGAWSPVYPMNVALNFVPRIGTHLPQDYDEKTSRTLPISLSVQMGDEKTRYYRVPLAKAREIKELCAEKDSNKARKNPLYKYLVADDRKTLPTVIAWDEGMYMLYRDIETDVTLPIDKHLDLGQMKEAEQQNAWFEKQFGASKNRDFREHVECAKQVDVAEYNWIATNDFDRQIGICPPLDPPKELEELYCETVFRAEGKSSAVLKHILKLEKDCYAAQKELEEMLFGAPDLKETFNVSGHSFSTYKSQFHPEFDHGKIIGIRCDWGPLYPHYTGMENVEPPEGWYEVSGHPGVYEPNPQEQPEQAALFAQCSYPDYRSFKDVFGDEDIVTITQAKDGYPRAYNNWPHVHALQDRYQQSLFYIDVPKDYNENLFRPTGSSRLSKYEMHDFRSRCGDMYEPHMMVFPEGTAVPDDYIYDEPNDSKAQKRYFMLSGASQGIYDAYLQEEKQRKDARDQFIKDVGGNGGYSSYMHGEMTRVCFDNDVPAFWKEERHNNQSRLSDDGDIEEYTNYECVPDEETAEGRALLKRMQSLPSDLSQDVLKKNLGVAEDVTMRIERFQDKTVFLFETEDSKDVFSVPKDAIEIPSSIMQWKKQDEIEARGKSPLPVMPEGLKKRMERLEKAMTEPSAAVKVTARDPKATKRGKKGQGPTS